MKEVSQNQMPWKRQLSYLFIFLIVFWLIEAYYGIEAGLLITLLLAILEVIWGYIREKRFEPFACWGVALILLIAIISWEFESEIFLKLRPAVFHGIFASI